MAKKNINLAKNLRKNLTETERYLWKFLRAKRLNGIKFKRQEPIGNFIIDFISYEKKLIIELDGGQHAEKGKREKDNRRDEWFERQGYKILRFWDNEVFTNIEGVLEKIKENCK